MADAPQSAAQTPAPPLPLPPHVPLPPTPDRARRLRRPRAGALSTLIFGALTFGSLTLPWAAYRGESGRSGELSWSGFDLMDDPERFASTIGHTVTSLHVVLWLTIGSSFLGLFRLLAPTFHVAWLAALTTVVLVAGTVVATLQFHNALVNTAVGPRMQAGPAVTGLAALLCATAAVFGVAAQYPARPRRPRTVARPGPSRPSH